MSTPARPNVRTSSPGAAPPPSGDTAGWLVIALLRVPGGRDEPRSNLTRTARGCQCLFLTKRRVLAGSQVALEELGATEAEGQVLAAVCGDGHHQVGRCDAAVGLETFRQPSVKGLLLALATPLLKDLDQHPVVGPLEPEPGVLQDQVPRRVLVDDLVAIAWRRREDLLEDLLDDVGQPSQLRGFPSLDDIDPDQWHGVRS